MKKAGNALFFLKGPNGKYPAEISEAWRRVVDFLGSLSACNCERGGLALEMTLDQIEKADSSQPQVTVTVTKYKTAKFYDGDAEVVFEKSDFKLIKSFAKVRQILTEKLDTFNSPTLLVDLDGSLPRHPKVGRET